MPVSRTGVLVLNLVYSHWFIDRDTKVIESQPYPLAPLNIPTKEKGRTLPMGVQATNAEALKLIKGLCTSRAKTSRA